MNFSYNLYFKDLQFVTIALTRDRNTYKHKANFNNKEYSLKTTKLKITETSVKVLLVRIGMCIIAFCINRPLVIL